MDNTQADSGKYHLFIIILISQLYIKLITIL